MSELLKKEGIIKWIDTENKIMAFQDENTYYDISDKVAEVISSKLHINKGVKVVAQIDSSIGEHGTVVFLVTEEDEKKPEKKDNRSLADKKIMTVSFIHWKSKAIIFDEEKNVWYTLIDKVFDYVKNEKIRKGDKIIFETEKQDRGNDLITRINRYEEGKKEEPKQVVKEVNEFAKPEKLTEKDAFYRVKELERQVRYLENEKQKSIEAQASINAANSTIATLFTGKFDFNNPSDGQKVKDLIAVISESNFKLIQELKK